ncbi:MAG: site-specific integrase [Clostridium sp.]|nr:site-specific integrase [Clostridium sp.]
MKDIEKIHPYAITAPTGRCKRWQTSYKDECGKRHNIKAPTKEELIAQLVILYSKRKFQKITVHMLFEEWLEYKQSVTSSINTVIRHREHYNRYILNTPMDKRMVYTITSLDVEVFCNKLITQHTMSHKEFGNVKTVLNGMFEYARRKGYMKTNIMNDVIISVKFRQVVKKTGQTQTYTTTEKGNLLQYLNDRYEETKDVSFLAVAVNFMIGLRVAELVSLKWTDLDGNTLHITREQILNKATRKYEIVPHTKTYSDRYVIIPQQAIEIFDRIPRDYEYIFTRKGEVLTTRQIAYILEKYAKGTDNQVKSSHKIRKTYASTLSIKGVPIDTIRQQLGHNNLSTTLTYIYDSLDKDETISLINSAFN